MKNVYFNGNFFNMDFISKWFLIGSISFRTIMTGSESPICYTDRRYAFYWKLHIMSPPCIEMCLIIYFISNHMFLIMYRSWCYRCCQRFFGVVIWRNIGIIYHWNFIGRGLNNSLHVLFHETSLHHLNFSKVSAKSFSSSVPGSDLLCFSASSCWNDLSLPRS